MLRDQGPGHDHYGTLSVSLSVGVLEAVGWLGILESRAPVAQRRDSSRVPEDFPLRGAFPALARRLPGPGAESCRCGEPSRLWHGAFPALARRVVAAGSLPGSGTESCRCAERCPHIERSTLRAARTLRGNDGQRSPIMLRRGNSPRSCRRTGTRREHRPGNPDRRNPAWLPPQGPHRITLQGRALRARSARGRTGRVPGRSWVTRQSP